MMKGEITMPSTIPYDPSLVLGNLVVKEKIEALNEINVKQAPIDAAEEKLNSLLETKRSIDMTIQELYDLENIEIPDDLVQKSKELNKKVTEAVIAYATAKINGIEAIQASKDKLKSITDVSNFESPVDYNKTQIKKMPLSSDSMKMSFQYFSHEVNEQGSDTTAATIKSFISGEVSCLGKTLAAQTAAAAQSALHNQNSNHDIVGTLVISVTCTHKDAVLLAPFILNVDKAIRVWNQIYREDPIKPDSLASMNQIAKQSDSPDEKCLTLLSGATYGSCFIGMVHVLNDTSTEASEKMYSIASSLQSEVSVGNWFSYAKGGFGIDDSFSNDMKSLLSSQNISSHCTLVSMGCIPSVKSNNVSLAVKEFNKFDGENAMKNLAALQTATAADKDTVDTAASAARTGGQMEAMKSSQIQAVLSGLSNIDDKQNKIIDINSLMTALEDYVDKALQGNIGVPINYYLKPITKSQLAEMWVSKYFPGKYLSISGDDNKPDPAKPDPAKPEPAPQ